MDVKVDVYKRQTLDAIRKLAVALSVSADMLLFEKDERGPDEDLKLQFEAVSRLDERCVKETATYTA